MNLKQIIIDGETSIDYVEHVFMKDYDVQLRFLKVKDFYDNFYRFSCILFDYAHKIKSVYMPVEGFIFEESVFLISQLEDQLEIEINHIVIESQFYEDIKCLCDFYEEDLKDGSLNIAVLDMCDFHNACRFSNFIDIIVFIEHKGINGLTVGLTEVYPQMKYPINIWRSIKKYVSIIYYKNEDKEYKGFVIE